MDYCVPDALPITYTSTYIISFLSVLAIRLVQGFLDLGDSSAMNQFYILITNVIVTVTYALDVFVYNIKAEAEAEAEQEQSNPERFTWSLDVQIQGVENPLRESIKEGIIRVRKSFSSLKNDNKYSNVCIRTLHTLHGRPV
jgi:hypothetical protein